MATRIDYAVRILRMLGAVEADGTFITGTLGTTSATTDLAYGDDAINGLESYVTSSSAACLGNIRYVSDFADTNNVLTPSAAWSAAPANLDTFIVVRPQIARVQQVLDSIAGAIRSLRLLRFTPLTDSTLIFGDLTYGDGQMERWTDGTTSAPDGFAVTGTGVSVARSTSSTHGNYACALTNQADQVATLTFTWPAPFWVASKTVSLYADVLSSDGAGDRARLRLTDGVTTTNSDYHTGGGAYEALDVTSFDVSSAPTSLVASLRIETGDAQTVTIDNLRLLVNGGFNSHAVMPAFYSISEIDILDEDDNYSELLPTPQWRVGDALPLYATAASTPQGTLYIRSGAAEGDRLLLKGEKQLTIPDDNTDTIDDEIGEYVVAYAMSEVLNSRTWSSDPEKQQGVVSLQTANARLGELLRPPSPNARRIKL